MKEIPLTQGKIAIIDDDDFGLISQHRWHFASNGYARRTATKLDGKSGAIWMHRIIAETPDGMETDHINGNKLDNRKSNLRLCTPSQNRRNRGKTKSNTTGFVGVMLDKTTGRYTARIRTDFGRIRLGGYPNPELAFAAYKQASEKFHGEFCGVKT